MEFSAVNNATLYNTSSIPLYSSSAPYLTRKPICALLLWRDTMKTGLAGYFVEDRPKTELIFPTYSIGKPIGNVDAVVCT